MWCLSGADQERILSVSGSQIPSPYARPFTPQIVLNYPQVSGDPTVIVCGWTLTCKQTMAHDAFKARLQDETFLRPRAKGRRRGQEVRTSCPRAPFDRPGHNGKA